MISNFTNLIPAEWLGSDPARTFIQNENNLGEGLATPRRANISIRSMPVPETMCKGWLCLMGSKHPEADKWRDGLCPECLDELAKQEIEDERNQRLYEL